MTLLRWPTIVLIAVALVALVTVDQRSDANEPTVVAAPTTLPIPVVSDAEALSSTWYCGGGTTAAGGVADSTLLLGNTTGRDIIATIRIFQVSVDPPESNEPLSSTDIVGDLVIPPPSSNPLPPVTERIVVSARSTVELRMIDIEGVGSRIQGFAAVLVEGDHGGLLATQRLSGPAGTTSTPCLSRPATDWRIASGTTRRGARNIIMLFNPFPTAAVANMTFAVDGRERGRAPQVYNQVVIPAETLLPVDITNVVTLFDSISTHVEVRSGRLLVTQVVSLETTVADTVGLSATHGVGQPAEEWIFPVSHIGNDQVDAIAVHNPSDEEARVSVEVAQDLASQNGLVEPFGITVRPGATEILVLGSGTVPIAEGRLIDGSARLTPNVGFWAAARSLNGVAIVADRITMSVDDAQASGFSGGLAATALEQQLLVGGEGMLSGSLAIVNPADDTIARVEVLAFRDGSVFTVGEIEVQPASRTVTDLDLLGIPADAVVVLRSPEPVAAEANLSLGGAPAVPVPFVPANDGALTPNLPI